MNADDPKKTPHQDGPEPVAEHWAVPIWLIVLFGFLFYWGQLFIAENAGGFSKDVYSPYLSYDDVSMANPQDPPARMRAEGKRVFDLTCTLCHQPNGLGKEGAFPPLAGSEWVQAASGDRIARIVLNGLSGPIKVKGQDWNFAMPPWRDNYNDQQLAAVLTYIRSQWGNKAGPIQPEVVKAARAEPHPGPETSDELMKIPIQ